MFYFPKDRFNLFIIKHGRFEVDQMPDSCSELRSYIESHFDNCVTINSAFGFRDPSLPDSEQRVSGFGVGRFTSKEENDARRELKEKYGSNIKRKETQILFKQEADIELAARSTQNIVLTFDARKGPLKEAFDSGHKVIFLSYDEAENFLVDDFMTDLLLKVGQYQI